MSGREGKVQTCISPIEPECGTDDKLLALACGDRYLRGVDIRSRKSVCPLVINLSILLCNFLIHTNKLLYIPEKP